MSVERERRLNAHRRLLSVSPFCSWRLVECDVVKPLCCLYHPQNMEVRVDNP